MAKSKVDPKVDVGQITKAIDALKNNNLDPETRELIIKLLTAFGNLLGVIQGKNISIGRLRRLLFKTTEKAKNLFKRNNNDSGKSGGGGSQTPPPKGHGRNAHTQYQVSKTVTCQHQLRPGDICPKCERGKVYHFGISIFLQFAAQPMIDATKFELEKLRCNSCLAIFEAHLPEGVVAHRYDDSVGVWFSLLRFGFSIPAYRTEQLLKSMGMPISDSQMNVLTEEVAVEVGDAIYNALIEKMANENQIGIDDTGAKIQKFTIENESKEEDERRGVFTTAVTGAIDGNPCNIFFIGRKHAGEILEDLLSQRTSLESLLVMADGSSKNEVEHTAVKEINCNTHNRRKFTDIITAFPNETKQAVDAYKIIYKNDAHCKTENMSPSERLIYHQENSLPIMEALRDDFAAKLDNHEAEPNSELGKAIKYFLKRYEKLIGFCKYPGALLDNNECERAIKKFVGYRKSSLHYKNERGAWIGERLMTPIHSAIACGKNPYHYLLALKTNAAKVRLHPDQWFPWNYQLNFCSS